MAKAGARRRKQRSRWPWLLLLLLLGYGLFWAPWLVIAGVYHGKITREPGLVPLSTAALVFGGLVTPLQPLNEINRERLLAARELLWTHRVNSIVVSNTPRAANAMQEFLVDRQVPRSRIEVDGLAVKTPDTCRDELVIHPEKRRVVFVSHAYHLPRILFQCQRYGLAGTGFAADASGDIRQDLPALETWWIRTRRLHREAWLTWLALAG